MGLESRDSTPAPALTAEASCYPEAGSVLIVSAHVSDDSVAPAIAGWQVVELLATGEQHEIRGGRHGRLLAARMFAEAAFSNIVGWQKLSATVLVARIRTSPQVAVSCSSGPRRRANGLRVPLWRS